ncbi:GrpB-like predicted nucleotidyltransferase (UPF0157 family) [Anaerobacterium chartisolvens]|uniref:GrpB-like predicted nucleotidyltransferase (UPF0157 family) n=1 Tax=Anaerobacterium chartisolvens TaxID=1297424 RepID=A0A369BA26_9FIRM|nr:GrpB family protein [Anaerobacterium chartisolvens]RCX18372.1 GrpB-like predicted nucleotidyltransferase (UPF0157 family) [Anaerobacterium chartisolvens]
MTKRLEQMNLHELGKLFPIIIAEHNPAWKKLYESERTEIENVVGKENITRISHYGSTAVPGLAAKPTIDILLEIAYEADINNLISKVKGMGYLYTPQPNNPAPHMMFMKGYTPDGFEGQAFHLHVRYSGDWDELYFRDYLLLNPEAAKEYEIVKRKLKDIFENDREAYTQGKTEFIRIITQQAREKLGQKY